MPANTSIDLFEIPVLYRAAPVLKIQYRIGNTNCCYACNFFLASFLDGITIHSAFDLKFGNEHVGLSDKKMAQFRENLADLQIVIIDEMSMVHSDTLYKIHVRLCEIFQTDDIFGNIGVILVGDLLQLPPVKGNYIFERPRNTHFASFHDVSPLWESFLPIVLTHNHRQGDGNAWAATLNRLREGQVSPEDEALLLKQLLQTEDTDPNTCHVFYTNAEVSNHNEKMLNHISSPPIVIPAILSVPKGYETKISPYGTIDSTQFMKKLTLKIGARVMLVFNVNTIDDLVNGALGCIVGFEVNKMGKAEAVIVKFDDGTCGVEQRRQNPRLSSKYKHEDGTPIFRQELEYQICAARGNSHAARAKVIQFPLRLSWAITCHKMQVIVLPYFTYMNYTILLNTM
jgi:hypothetical protein